MKFGELAECPKDTYISITIPQNAQKMRKFPNRLHFLVESEGEMRLPAHVKAGNAKKVSTHKGKSVVCRVYPVSVERRSGGTIRILGLSPDSTKVANALLRHVGDGEFQVVRF